MNNSYTIDQISDFLYEHAWNIVGTWPQETLGGVIYGFDKIGGLGIARQGNEIIGVAWAKCIDDPESNIDYDFKQHNEEGCTVFIDLVAVSHPKAFRTLILIMINRFRRRLMIAFNRKKYGCRVSVHNFRQFCKKIRI